METEMNTRLELARKRKEEMEIERKYNKIRGEIDSFVKHSLHREKIIEKNRKLYELYKQQMEENLEVFFVFDCFTCSLIE